MKRKTVIDRIKMTKRQTRQTGQGPMERNRDRNRQKETKGETERGRELDGQLHKQTKVADIKMVDKKTAETDITERKREKQI